MEVVIPYKLRLDGTTAYGVGHGTAFTVVAAVDAFGESLSASEVALTAWYLVSRITGTGAAAIPWGNACDVPVLEPRQ